MCDLAFAKVTKPLAPTSAKHVFEFDLVTIS